MPPRPGAHQPARSGSRLASSASPRRAAASTSGQGGAVPSKASRPALGRPARVAASALCAATAIMPDQRWWKACTAEARPTHPGIFYYYYYFSSLGGRGHSFAAVGMSLFFFPHAFLHQHETSLPQAPSCFCLGPAPPPAQAGPKRRDFAKARWSQRATKAEGRRGASSRPSEAAEKAARFSAPPASHLDGKHDKAAQSGPVNAASVSARLAAEERSETNVMLTAI